MNSKRLLLVLLAAAAFVVPAARGTSLWPENASSLFADTKAYKVGDVVTVLVEETSSAQSSGTSSFSKESDTEAEVETLQTPYGGSVHSYFTKDKPKAKFANKRSFTGSGSHTLSGSIKTSLAVVVKEVLPNGNLIVEGSRVQKSIDEKVNIRITGILRPQDIKSNNTVPSSALAEAKIIMESSGPITRSSKRGWLDFILDLIWPF